jgi:hypothetical protein
MATYFLVSFWLLAFVLAILHGNALNLFFNSLSHSYQIKTTLTFHYGYAQKVDVKKAWDYTFFSNEFLAPTPQISSTIKNT